MFIMALFVVIHNQLLTTTIVILCRCLYFIDSKHLICTNIHGIIAYNIVVITNN